MKIHVLVISNDKAVIKTFSNAFLKIDSPCKCTCADDVSHAREMMNYIVPDCIFIKLDPNIIQSLEFVSSLKRTLRYRKIKIAAFADHIAYYRSLSQAFGADLCMEPPRNEKDIYKVIDTLNPKRSIVE